jgi:hypothetical protein
VNSMGRCDDSSVNSVRSEHPVRTSGPNIRSDSRFRRPVPKPLRGSIWRTVRGTGRSRGEGDATRSRDTLGRDTAVFSAAETDLEVMLQQPGNVTGPPKTPIPPDAARRPSCLGTPIAGSAAQARDLPLTQARVHRCRHLKSEVLPMARSTTAGVVRRALITGSGLDHGAGRRGRHIHRTSGPTVAEAAQDL